VVDVAFSLTWFNSGWDIPTGHALADRGKVDIAGGTLPVLDPAFDFLFLCLHLFREGWLVSEIGKKDVRLAQFADICRHWERCGRQRATAIRAAVDRYHLDAPIGWVTGHTDALFGTTASAGLGLTAYTSTAWLGSACQRAGTYLQWSGTMDQRLAAHGPARLSTHDDPGQVASLMPARG
jgi:Uncharacterised nucleotidyltransferase